MKKKIKEKNYLAIILGSAVLVYVLLILIESAVFSTRLGFSAKAGNISLGLKTKNEAIKILESETAKYRAGTILIGQTEYQIKDFIKTFNNEKTIDSLFDRQSQNFPAFGIFFENSVPVEEELSSANLSRLLLGQYNRYAVPPMDPAIKIENLTVTSGVNGQRLYLAESREMIENDLASLSRKSGFRVQSIKPMIDDSEVAVLLNQARKASESPILISNEKNNFEITSDTLRNWLKVTPQSPKTIIAKEVFIPEEDSQYFYFDPVSVKEYVDKLAEKIGQPKINAKLAMSENGLIVTEPEQDGEVLDKIDTTQKIQEAALGDKSISLKINREDAEVRIDNLANLGIRELLSTGWSDFSGSPANRVHNFRVGASKFNGALIKPGEKFSFNETLGPVEASTGYLPELVILENKTTPQYGGGLCQVSSTAFRAALNAGFPILERTMHAYPVVYYKPYGVDATIYLPKPDLVFRNDSGHYVLIQTRISGTRLFFDFYGTKSAKNIKFAGNKNGTGGIYPVEEVTPALSDFGARGPRSFTAAVYRLLYDTNSKLIRTDIFISRYDSPDKFPH